MNFDPAIGAALIGVFLIAFGVAHIVTKKSVHPILYTFLAFAFTVMSFAAFVRGLN